MTPPNTNMAKQLQDKSVLFLCACVITGLVYLPGFGGVFMHDDMVNIVHNPQIHINALTYHNVLQLFCDGNGESKILSSRAVAKLSFAVNYLIGGIEPYGYKLTNFLFHLLTAAAIFLLMSLIARVMAITHPTAYHPLTVAQGHWIALFAAIIWLIHPLHISTVLYVVQRMAQLATLFTVLGLCAYVKYRIDRLEEKHSQAIKMLFIGLFICWPLGILSKENAVVLPLLCLVIEFTLLQFVKMDLLLKRLYQLFALSIIGGLIYFLYNPSFILDTYQTRDFVLKERLMTQPRILWGYLHNLLLPDISRMGLYLDDFPLSTSFLTPFTTLVAIVAWCAMLTLVFFWRRRFPMFSFAVLWFLVAHSVESSIIGLEIAYEHRNYLPSVGIFACVSWGVLALHEHYDKLRPLLKTAGVLSIIMLVSLTFLRSDQWAEPIRHAQTEVRHHPRSYRANIELGRLLLDDRRLAEAEVAFDKIKYTERPFANHYMMLLAAKHLQGQNTDALYQEAIQAFASQRVYIIIFAQIKYHIYLAKINGWTTPETLIKLVKALLRNPYLQKTPYQAKLNQILADLYAKNESQSLMKKLPKDNDRYVILQDKRKVYANGYQYSNPG